MTDPATTEPQQPSARAEGYADAWQRLALALNEMAAHLVATAAVLVSINLLELLIKYVAHGELVFFKGLTFEFNGQWLFDAMDMGLLIVLSLRMLYVFYKVYRG